MVDNGFTEKRVREAMYRSSLLAREFRARQ
jgi:hypothetical protein